MIRKLNKYSKILGSYLIPALFFIQTYCLSPNTIYASDQLTCGDRLNQAEESYYNGDFNTAIDLINQCLQVNTISNDNRIQGYKLLAKIYQSQKENDKAKANIYQILLLDPDYQPTIEEERPSFVELVNKARTEFQTTAIAEADSGISKWVWIGAGGAAAVAIIAIITSGSGSSNNQTQPQSLPGPPDFPE